MLRIIFISVFLLILVLVAYTVYVSRPLYSEKRSELPMLQELASSDQALTFARTENSLLLVTGVAGETVKSVDLSAIFGLDMTADPIGLYQAVGYDSLASLTDPEVSVETGSLLLPLDFGQTHLAVGTNYIEHSEEVMLDDPPFLFPKITEPTSWNAPVRFAKRLDFEAELAFVPLSAISSADSTPAHALILANDFTNRWTLIKQLKLREPMGTTGFAAAKGQESFLPTGYFLVIPRDKDFYKTVEVRLFVNDRLRQRFNAADMIVNYEATVAQAFIDRDQTYRNGDQVVDLIPPAGIERGSLILSGTAGGVIFKPANIWWQRPYLKRGDVVRTEASFLGVLENAVH